MKQAHMKISDNSCSNHVQFYYTSTRRCFYHLFIAIAAHTHTLGIRKHLKREYIAATERQNKSTWTRCIGPIHFRYKTHLHNGRKNLFEISSTVRRRSHLSNETKKKIERKYAM